MILLPLVLDSCDQLVIEIIYGHVGIIKGHIQIIVISMINLSNRGNGNLQGPFLCLSLLKRIIDASCGGAASAGNGLVTMVVRRGGSACVMMNCGA